MIKVLLVAFLICFTSAEPFYDEETDHMLVDIFTIGQCIAESKYTFINDFHSIINSIKTKEFDKTFDLLYSFSEDAKNIFFNCVDMIVGLERDLYYLIPVDGIKVMNCMRSSTALLRNIVLLFKGKYEILSEIINEAIHSISFCHNLMKEKDCYNNYQ